MRNRDEIIGAVIDQVKWSKKTGRIDLIGMDEVMDAAEQVLTDNEYDLAGETGIFREVLWSI